MGNRISSLPIAQFCSGSVLLGAKFGAGRAAAMSSAFHAIAGEQPDAMAKMARLTQAEQETIRDWHAPEDVDLDDGIWLRWGEATREQFIAMDQDGAFTDDPGKSVTTGHPDGYWVIDHDDVGGEAMRIVYVADMKKTDFSTVGGSDSLQLAGYGFTLCDKHEADGYISGEWNITDGEWSWSPMVLVEGEDAEVLLARILAAAQNTDGQFTQGTHCRDCYGRMHCHEHLLPVMDPEAALYPFSQPGGLTADNAPLLLNLYQRAKDLMDVVKDQLTAQSKAMGGIPDGEGKVWKEVTSKGGKRKLNEKALGEKLLEENEQYCEPFMYNTKPRSMGCRWVKG